MTADIKEKLKRIKLMVFDFDGVMTDGYVYVNHEGIEFVKCSRKDGLGIKYLREAGIKVFVISTETNKVVSARCKKLNVACFQKIQDKLKTLKEIMAKEGLGRDEVAYMADDLNDLEALKHAGVRFSVADAHPNLRKSCHCVTKSKGGHHAVREAIELILKSRKK